ncbi:MAG TPA: DUF177 domain-containing protein [Chitinophagaceae bacterium]|jgi:uncharacterized metal-binding protein YceD (DUF177 family)|nr:DUF177 domain-containing protein [Chitinophagaceae bacterium]
MSGRREFDIAFVGLKPGVHEYNYEIDEKFFAPYPPQDFSNVKAKIRLMLEKNTNFMLLKFEVGGTADAQCDRCGNPLPLQLWDDFEVLVKLVDDPERMNNEEEDPDVFYISRGESHLNVENWIYEFITLSVPTHRMCPEDQIGGPQCNKEVLEMLKKMNETENKSQNPIWKGLDKFRNI